MRKEKKYLLWIVGMLLLLVFVVGYFTSTSAIVANNEYTGDQYVTSTTMTDSSNKVISNNGTMEINEIYNLAYRWEIPDNLYNKGDILVFSIPKEFKIVQSFKFNLYQDKQEVAQATILGNEDTGYSISMRFTTEYVGTHSAVSGTFALSYILNEKYIQLDGDNTIILPDKELVIHVPKPEEGSSGGGAGVDAGDVSKNKKEGEAILVNLPETPNKTSTVFNWNIGLGRKTMLGKAASFDEIKHIYIEDTPHDQKMVSFEDVSSGWDGSYGFEGGFFTTLPWEYGGVSQERMGLIRDGSNSYYEGFKTDILPAVQNYEKLAQDKGSEFKQYKLEYYTTPLNEVVEDTEFKNDAKITIVYEDNSEKIWQLSESQMYTIAEGTITGKTAGVKFQKVDGETAQGLDSAIFDLYKKNSAGNFTKIKSNIVSGADGQVKVDNLTTGDYYFSEIQAPEGYEQSNEPFAFTIETKDLLEANQSIVYKDIGLFENELEMTQTAISVKKIWNDQNNQDGKRPNNIAVQLYGNNQTVGTPVILNDSNKWRYEWAELDEKANGQFIVYTVKEVTSVPEYQETTTIDANGTIVLTNTYVPEKTSISGTKTWDDQNDQDGKRPNEIVVNLLADGLVIDHKKVTESNGWKYTFVSLPKYKNGQIIQYTVTENHVPEYTTEIKGTAIKNSYIPGQTTVSVTKVWEDADNQDGKRPNSITVQLYGDDQAVGTPVILNDSNKWRYEWAELDEKANGQFIVYTVKEVTFIPGYQGTSTIGSDGTIVLTNTYVPEKTSISGTKTWDDQNDQDGKRPNEIVVNLLADGLVIDHKKVTESNDWKYTFVNLPKYKNGQVIQYTVTENHVPEYTTEIKGTAIKNSYTPGKTSVSVTKAWEDANDQDGKRPNLIMVQLYANGQAQGEPVQLNEANQWQHTWIELDEKANGKEIVYSVNEIDSIVGYNKVIDTSNIGNIIIRNTHIPETTVIAGIKQWEDKDNQDGLRPSEITVNLLANGEKVAEKVVTQVDNWAYEFIGLPKYSEGQEIQYTVTENQVPEYSVELVGTNLINHYTPGQTSLTVTKAWNDANNQDGKRPESITVQLYADGQERGGPVLLTQSNAWQHTWTELDEKSNGQTINYSVKELTTDEAYVLTINDDDSGNVIITNSHTPETTQIVGSKTWDDKDNQDGKRPDTITVILLADGMPVAEKDVTKTNDWQYAFTDLPKYANGEEIQYRIVENTVPEYTTERNGWDLTNHYTPGKTSVTVTKTWADANDQAQKRPETISVQLYANEQKIGDQVLLSAVNQWQHTWIDLDAKAAGQEIIYTVKEVDVPQGYTVTINDAYKQVFILTNTYQSEVPVLDSSVSETPNMSSHKGSMMPLLGEVATVGSLLTGLGIFGALGSIYHYRKKKK